MINPHPALPPAQYQPPSRLLGSPALSALALYALAVYSLAVDPNGVLTGCLGRATLELPIFLGRLVRDTIRLVGSAVAAQVLVADRAALFPIVCAFLRQANSVFDGIGLRVPKSFIVCWEYRSYEERTW